MKKLFLLIATLSITLGAVAQKGKVTSALSYIDQGNLDKAKEALDEALNNEKSKDWDNTYFALGKLCQAVFTTDNPKFKDLYKDPLTEAYNAYQKALELDKKGSMKKKIITSMAYNNLAVNLYNQGSKKFEEKDYQGALESFEKQIKITESDLYAGALDTGMYYNAGLAAINADKPAEAIKYFEKCTDMNYMGITPYFQIYSSYMAMGDTAKGESVLTGLKEKFPNNKDVILQLIDLYIKSGKNKEALDYIKNAKEADPGNYSLYFAAGIIYLNEENYDNAIEELKKSIELKGDLYDTQYGLGAAYINKASGMFTKANDIMDVNEYTKAIDEANAVYAKALPYMEKALELKPDDVYAMRSLRELYYRLKKTDKYNEIKAKLDSIDGGNNQ
jgi:tetratricopeptide (TPR) repeat protein